MSKFLQVNVAFHAPEFSSRREAEMEIVDIIARHFAREDFTITPSLDPTEIVVEFAEPVMKSSAQMVSFFESMRSVFLETASYIPSFTQEDHKVVK